MNKKTLTKLEYNKIIELLTEQASSFSGKERCRRLKPMTSLSDIQTAQEQTAAAFTAARLDGSLLSLFVLGIFCNLLMFFGVDGYKNIKHDVGKYIVLFLSISLFILCGFEHCVADMFYFAAARMITGETMLRLAVITAGNMVGSVLLPLSRRLFRD